MSIAWSTAVILVLLFPGLLFFVGLYLPESFSRESSPPNLPSQIAATLLVSFFFHGIAFGVLETGFIPFAPRISLEHVFAALQLNGDKQTSLPDLASNIREFIWAILAYVAISAASGMGLGYLFGRAIVRGHLLAVASHAWLYSIEDTPDSISRAYILTRVQHLQSLVMYSGYVIDFGISPAGRINYMVLTGCERYYLSLTVLAPRTGPSQLISSTSPDKNYFFIEGEDIINVFWDRVELPPKEIPKGASSDEGAEDKVDTAAAS